MTSQHFKPDLQGESTREMRRKKKIKAKTRCNDGWTTSNDNGPVAFGTAFKWLKG